MQQLRYLQLDLDEIIGELIEKDNKNVVSYDVYKGYFSKELRTIPARGSVELLDNNGRIWYDEIIEES